MTGLKYKLAHKRFDKEKWNISDAAQRKRLINLLKQIMEGLEKDWVDSKEEVLPKQEVDVKKLPHAAKKRATRKDRRRETS